MIGGIGANYNIGILFAFSKDLYIFYFQAFALEVDKIDAVMICLLYTSDAADEL